MVCPVCGAANPESAASCAQCGRGLTNSDDSQTVYLESPSSTAPLPTPVPKAAAAAAGIVTPTPEPSEAMTWGAIHSQPGATGPSSFAPGSNFGRYRIEALLGEGGMGAVFKAYDTELNRTVALKLVRPELATSAQTMQRFKQELLLASKISHKNVLRIHDLGDWNGVKFISMAFVEGMDLAALMERTGRLELERGLKFTRQLCAALEAAHAEGVVHRDLKPQNILIDRGDNVYISDFGLAKSLEAEISMGTRTGQILGTPRYMSPEQVEAREVDARSDMYSLGLIVYEMFTGELPFRGDSAMQLMYQRVSERPRDPRQANPELPDYIANVILKCLEKDPAKRYQSAREIAADLDARHAPAVSGPAGSKTISIQIPKPTRRGLALSVAATVLLGALLAAVPATRRVLLGALPGARKAAQAPAIRYYLAVLPLNIAGDEASLRYLAGGLVDSLTAKLAGLRNVYVASNIGPALLKQSDEQIARTLGVNILVRGSITGAGERIAITVKADDVKNRRTLLNAPFQGVRKDFLTIEDSVFDGLVRALTITETEEELARTAIKPTQNIDAYDLYLQGQNLLRGTKSLENAQKAVAFFKDAIARDPRFPLAYAGMADALVRMFEENQDRGTIEQALGAAQQAQRLNDSLPEVHNSLGTIYALTGRTEGAIVELRRAIQLAPNSDDAWRRLGVAYEKAGQRDKEVEALREAIRINPYYARNYNVLGDAYFDLGQNEKALQMYEQVANLAPENPVGWANQGSAYYRLGRLDDCVAAYRKAISLSPRASFYTHLGVAYFYLGRFPEAAQSFETAVQKDPGVADFWVNLADSYRHAGQRDKAAAAYENAVKLAYKALQTNARDSAALGILATSYAKKGDLPKAEQFIRQARQIHPKDNDLMYREATIHALAGNFPQALASLKEALQNGYSVVEAKADPELARLRESAEFTALMRDITTKPRPVTP